MTEPDGVWKVSCECGYAERFRYEEDARVVFRAHAESRDLRCGAASMDERHAYSKGGVEPEKTLPRDRVTA